MRDRNDRIDKSVLGRFAVCALGLLALLAAANGCGDQERRNEFDREADKLARTVEEIQEMQLGLLITEVRPQVVLPDEVPRLLESGSVQAVHERNERLIDLAEQDMNDVAGEIRRMRRLIALKGELDRVRQSPWRRE